MTSSKPYLIRALYEWISENDLKSHILVNTNFIGVCIPKGLANEDGQIVLNISTSAVQGLAMNNAIISFRARFTGHYHDVCIPVGAVLAIYAQENGQGMMFEDTSLSIPPHTPEKSESQKPRPGERPSLKIVN